MLEEHAFKFDFFFSFFIFFFSPVQGMDDYISKPVDQQRLQEVLDKWRERHTECTIISRERLEKSNSPLRSFKASSRK